MGRIIGKTFKPANATAGKTEPKGKGKGKGATKESPAEELKAVEPEVAPGEDQ